MIQLYIPSNQNFEMNGNITLEATLCDASFNLNSVWNLELEAPIKYIDYIVKEAVVKVPTPYGNQLYRIYSTEKDEDTIYAWANPIFLDAKNDCFLWDVRPTDKNGQEALDIIFDKTKYSGKSNIRNINTLYIQQKNAISAINGDDGNTFINRWGGEIAYNNYQIIINERLGSDNGARAEFGYNLASIKENVDMSNVITRIIPKAYNGIVLPNQETIDSPNINKYAIVYTKVIEYSNIKLSADAFEGDAEAGCIICNTLEDVYTALRERANAEFENGIDLPMVNYEVDIVDLSNCDEYKDIKTLVALQLGDDIYCKNKRLNIETKARVIGMKYDCISQKTKELNIGDYQPTVFDSTTDVIQRIENIIDKNNNTIMAEKVNGVLNMLQTSLRAQKNAAQKSDVRAILFEDLDPNSPTFGAMSIGTKGIQIAGERNETNTDWLWGTAIDFKTMYANYIITGILSDKLGNNYWDLDKGEFVSNNGKFSGLLDGAIFNSSKTTKVTYTTEDVNIVSDHLRNGTPLTPEQIEKYDLNNDGYVLSSDSLLLARLLGDKSSVTVDVVQYVEVNKDNSNIVKAGKKVGDLRAYETTINGGIVDSISFFGSRFIAGSDNSKAELNNAAVKFELSLDTGGSATTSLTAFSNGGFGVSYSEKDANGTQVDYVFFNYDYRQKKLISNTDIYTSGTITAKEYITL